MRTFFGLELPPDVALQIADWRDRQLNSAGRAVPVANFHITLAFMGTLRPGPMERLCLALEAWLEQDATYGGELNLDCTGYWPRPGIYWFGAGQWPPALTRLATKLRGLGSAAGAKRDRNPFHPHITLFRNCDTAPPAPPGVPSITLPYQHFTLFESRQGKSGVSYHPLQSWELAPHRP